MANYDIGTASGLTNTEVAVALAKANTGNYLSYLDYGTVTQVVLTTTPQLVTGFTENIAPLNMGCDGDTFTNDMTGATRISIERKYLNYDANVQGVINCMVIVMVDLNDGNGEVEFFSRTTPIGEASGNNNDPSVLSLTTESVKIPPAGATFKIYVSAEEGGSNPSDTRLALMKVTASRGL